MLLARYDDPKNWRLSKTYNFEMDPDGDNVVAIKAWDVYGDRVGMIANMNVNGKSYYTSSSWQANGTYQPGWETLSFNDSGWNNAVVKYGPWLPNPLVDGKWIWTEKDDNVAYFRFNYDIYTFKGNIYFMGNQNNGFFLSQTKYPLDNMNVEFYEKQKTGDVKIGETKTKANGDFEEKIPISNKNANIYYVVKADDAYSKVYKKQSSSDVIKHESGIINMSRAVNRVLDFGSKEAKPGGAFNIIKSIDRGRVSG